MAVTKIIPIRSTIQRSVDYICNPDKTEGHLLVHSEHCVPQTAGQIFHHHLNKCRAGGNTIGRHLIQSFAPNETDPSTAHEIGKQLAEEILGGRYAFVLATHVDRGHIHNHFIWGAADIVSHKRYRSNKASYHEIRNISDRLCKEQNLSVIVPQGIGKHYAEWKAEKQDTSWKQELKNTIDTTISISASFEDFVKQMEQQGYTIKHGKHIAFKAPDQERFTRSKRLGTEYTEEEITRRISQSVLLENQKTPFSEEVLKKETPTTEQARDSHQAQAPKSQMPQQKTQPTKSEAEKQISAPTQTPKDKSRAPSMPPTQTQTSKPPLEGIALWESVIRKPNTAEIYNLMQQHGGYQHFVDLMTEKRISCETIDNGIKANEKRLAAWGYLRKDIVDLNRTKKIYDEYKTLQKSTKLFSKRTAEKFHEKHESEILTHERVLRDLKDHKRPLPTLKEIDAEVAKGKSVNTANWKHYRAAKAEHKRFTDVHKTLFAVNLEHKPKEQKRQVQRSRGDDLSV